MRQNKRDDEGEPEEEDGAMKICGACGLGLDRSCFSNKQWQQSKQKRRCRECVDKSTAPAGGEAGHGTSEAESEHGGTDGDRNEEPRSPPEEASVNDVVQSTGASSDGQPVEPRSPVPVQSQIADDVECAGKSSEGQADGDEICGICLDVFDNPVQLPCGHSFCEVCLDGWHKKFKFDVHQPRNCPMCRQRTKPSKEIISQLYAYAAVVKDSKEGYEFFMQDKAKLRELMSPLLKMGHTNIQRRRLRTCYKNIVTPNSKIGCRTSF